MTSADQRTVEWIHRRLDGELSEEESEKLDEILAGDQEVRQLEADLRELEESLRSIPLVTPPEHLRGEIARLVASRQTKAPARTSSGVVGRWWTYGYAAAAGLLLGVILYPLVMTPAGYLPGDPEAMQGSLVRTLEPIAASSTALLSAGESEAWIELQAADEAVVLSLASRTAGEETYRVDFPPDELRYLGLEHSSPVRLEIDASPESLRISGLAGTVRLRFQRMEGKAARVDVGMAAANGAQAARSFVVPKSGEER